MAEQAPSAPVRFPAPVEPGEHGCFLYQSEAEHRRVLTAFLQEGLRHHDKVLYLVHDHSYAVVIDYLYDMVPNVASYVASGQLSSVEATSVYLSDGAFNPERMIHFIESAVEEAQREGYRGLRGAAEMTWALKNGTKVEQLMEYESKVNSVFREVRCTALCLYDRRAFPPEAIWNAVMTHPVVVHDHVRCRNDFFIRPEEFLDPQIRPLAVRNRLQRVTGEEPADDVRINARATDLLLKALGTSGSYS